MHIMEWMFIRTFRRDRSRFRSTFLRGEAGCIQKGINGVRVIDSTPLISTAGIAFTSTTKAATTRWRASMARANMRACATTTPIRTGYRSNSPKTTAAASGRPATGLGQHPGRNAGKLLRRRAEPALPGPVPGPRNRAALQHLQVLRSGYRTVYQPGSDWVGGWDQPVPVCAGTVWVGGSVGVGQQQPGRIRCVW